MSTGGKGQGTTVASWGPSRRCWCCGWYIAPIMHQNRCSLIGSWFWRICRGCCFHGKNHISHLAIGFILSYLSIRSSILATKGGGNSRLFFEPPGSIDFAGLFSCNDESFALRTKAEINHGTVERSGGIVALGGVWHRNVHVIKFGKRWHRRNDVTTPVFIVLTPHHFITLN
jgi:hypothetical protein